MIICRSEICTGCGVCAVKCPKCCITMSENSEGFRYPIIDTDLCIECGLCKKVCPVLNLTGTNEDCETLAAKNKETEIRKKSSSGGVFMALAKETIKSGGAVCAAKYNNSFEVVHSIAEDEEELKLFCGAKYSQSKTEHCYVDIMSKLEKGQTVMFVGTPCQVAALNNYFDKNYDNLLLVDMICHGVPSPKVWKAYLYERLNADAQGSDIEYINNRSKVSGWSNYSYSLEIGYANGAVYQKRQSEDWFMRGFTGNLFLRRSCENCQFKGMKRLSDITLADYWGVWKQYPDFDDNLGVSLLLLHSEKGRKLWEKVESSFSFMKIPTESAISENPSALKSSAAHTKRSYFFEELSKAEKTVSDIIELCLVGPKDEISLLKKVLKKIGPKKFH